MPTNYNHPAPGTTAQPAVLELGADVGAAVIYTTAAHDGTEIEITPQGHDWDGSHTAIRRRPSPPGCEPQYAALFFNLPAGTYHLRLDRRIQTMHVTGGQVTEQTW